MEEIVIPRNAMIADVLGSQKAQSSKHLACRVREGLDYLSLVVLVLAPEKIRIEQHFETRRDLSKKSPRLQEILIGGEQDKKRSKGGAPRSAVVFTCSRFDILQFQISSRKQSG